MTACYPLAILEETVNTVSLLATVCDIGDVSHGGVLSECSSCPRHRKLHIVCFSCMLLSWRYFPKKLTF